MLARCGASGKMHPKAAALKMRKLQGTIDICRGFTAGEAYGPIPDVSHLANVLLRFHREFMYAPPNELWLCFIKVDGLKL